jgi:hypothetical protein
MACKPLFTSQARDITPGDSSRTIFPDRIPHPTGVGLMCRAPLSLCHPPLCRNCAPWFGCRQARSMVTCNPGFTPLKRVVLRCCPRRASPGASTSICQKGQWMLH